MDNETLEAYRFLDTELKRLYFMNQDWFKVRDKMTPEEKKELFEWYLKTDLMANLHELRIRLAQLAQKYGATNR